uniref:(northern house mosquito) hypothetical protein n=1 Tax=Culex pipiens TaxID=7175 RepID=A0A8D8P0Z9_CULPI
MMMIGCAMRRNVDFLPRPLLRRPSPAKQNIFPVLVTREKSGGRIGTSTTNTAGQFSIQLRTAVRSSILRIAAWFFPDGKITTHRDRKLRPRKPTHDTTTIHPKHTHTQSELTTTLLLDDLLVHTLTITISRGLQGSGIPTISHKQTVIARDRPHQYTLTLLFTWPGTS